MKEAERGEASVSFPESVKVGKRMNYKHLKLPRGAPEYKMVYLWWLLTRVQLRSRFDH